MPKTVDIKLLITKSQSKTAKLVEVVLCHLPGYLTLASPFSTQEGKWILPNCLDKEIQFWGRACHGLSTSHRATHHLRNFRTELYFYDYAYHPLYSLTKRELFENAS